MCYTNVRINPNYNLNEYNYTTATIVRNTKIETQNTKLRKMASPNTHAITGLNPKQSPMHKNENESKNLYVTTV